MVEGETNLETVTKYISKMKFISTPLTLVLFVVGESLANTCPTCRGSDCFKKNIFQLDCTKFVPALPFESQILLDNIGSDVIYGCLNLRYYIGDEVDVIHQCIETSDLDSYCKMLEGTIKIDYCSVTGITSKKPADISSELIVDEVKIEPEKKDIKYVEENEQFLEEGSGTDEPDAPGSTEPPEGNGVTHFVSWTAFVAIVATILF